MRISAVKCIPLLLSGGPAYTAFHILASFVLINVFLTAFSACDTAPLFLTPQSSGTVAFRIPSFLPIAQRRNSSKMACTILCTPQYTEISEQGGGVSAMGKQKLRFRFHNPNSAEITADYIARLFVEVDHAKLEYTLQIAETDNKQNGRAAAK